MRVDFSLSLSHVLTYEGGYSNNPRDPGGVTMRGITQRVYNVYRANKGQPIAPVSKIGEAELEEIYDNMYWQRIWGDKLPAGVDFCMFDAAVNSGVGGATSWAQGALGVDVDGDFGQKTMDAIIQADPEDLIRKFCAHRLGSLERLKTWSYFGKGWHARIANVQRAALAMAEGGDVPDAVAVHVYGGQVKTRLSDVPISKTSTIATHATVVGGAVATGVAQAAQSLSAVGDTFGWIKYILGGLTITGAIAGLVVLFGAKLNDAASNGVATAKVNPDADEDMTSDGHSAQAVTTLKTPVAPPVPVATNTQHPAA